MVVCCSLGGRVWKALVGLETRPLRIMVRVVISGGQESVDMEMRWFWISGRAPDRMTGRRRML